MSLLPRPELSRIGTACQTRPDGDPRALDAAARLDATLACVAEFNKVPLSNVLSPGGCSRKLDVNLDPSVNKNKLRLQARGTVGGAIRKDNDDFTYRR